MVGSLTCAEGGVSAAESVAPGAAIGEQAGCCRVEDEVLLLGRHLVALLQQLPHLAQLLVCGAGRAGRAGREGSR